MKNRALYGPRATNVSIYGCEYEAKDPVNKPTTFMANAPEVARELRQRCQGRGGACSRPQGGRHAQCRSKTARMAAVYHFKLCRAIVVGLWNQLPEDGVCKDGFISMLESGMEKREVPAVVPRLHLTNDKGSILKVQIEGDKVFLDDRPENCWTRSW